MQIQDIENLIREARKIVPASVKSVTKNTDIDYKKYAYPIFGLDLQGELRWPSNVDLIVEKVRTAQTLSTLQKRATAIRYVAMLAVSKQLDSIDKAASNGLWNRIEKVLNAPEFNSMLRLAGMYPVEYKKSWQPVRSRMGKKNSAKGLPDYWREKLILQFTGQFKIPATIVAMTGARPSELEKGVHLHRDGQDLYIKIHGAKVTEYAGQRIRVLKIDHPLKSILIDYMNQQQNRMSTKVIVKCGNSVSTYIRNNARKLFPEHKQTITCYSFRHAIASDAKKMVSKNKLDSDTVSMLLGHRVDKTATYYGHHSKSSGGSMAPTEVVTSQPVKHKLGPRNEARKLAGKIPIRRGRLRKNQL